MLPNLVLDINVGLPSMMATERKKTYLPKFSRNQTEIALIEFFSITVIWFLLSNASRYRVKFSTQVAGDDVASQWRNRRGGRGGGVFWTHFRIIFMEIRYFFFQAYIIKKKNHASTSTFA